MFGINNPRLVEMRLARRRMQRSRWWRRLRDAEKYPPEFPPLQIAIGMRSKRKIYGRQLRQLNTPMFMFRPKWWFVGHPDWLEVTRAYEHEHGQLPDEARAAFKDMRDQWDKYMGRKK